VVDEIEAAYAWLDLWLFDERDPGVLRQMSRGPEPAGREPVAATPGGLREGGERCTVPD
jgi:hypothetical protein